MIHEKVLKVFGVSRSQPTRTVLWLLHLKSQPFKLIETIPASRQSNGSRHADFLHKFPTGVVPALEDTDGFCLAESNAILTYLCVQHEWTDMYPYKDAQRRAKVDEILHWHHTNTRAVTVALLRMLNPQLARNIPEVYMQVQSKVAIKALKHLEKRLDQSQSKYLCGDDLTIADLCVYGDVGQVSPRWNMPTNVFDASFDVSKLTNVSKWMVRMENVPEYDVVHEAYRCFISKL